MAYPVTLNGRTYTLADFEGTNYVDGLPDAFEDFVTHAGAIYKTTSTSSVTIGTGSKSFTTADSNLPYQEGTPLRISDGAAPSTNWMDGVVTAYSGTSLTVNVLGYAGSGTLTDWDINIGGGPNTISGTLPVAQGGTGATSAADARTNLGLGTIATQASDSVSITGGSVSGVSITGITDLAIAEGGTGASDAATARTNLGVAASGANTDITSLSGVTSVNGSSLSGRKNLVLNGAMAISQRGTETGVTVGYGGPDRFLFSTTSAAVVSLLQSTDVPSGQGFANSFRIDVTTADSSIAAGDSCLLMHRIEGYTMQPVKKGTANAEQLTVSFWIKTTITGTYVCELFDNDNNRHVAKSYTVSSSNTWEKKTITYPADTTGTLDNDANRSFQIMLWLAAGSDYSSGTLPSSWASYDATNGAAGQVNAISSASNDIYFTGVQMEIGDTATDFEFRTIGQDLADCQRYYFYVPGALYGGAYGTSFGYAGAACFPTTMRASPTLSYNTVRTTSGLVAYSTSNSAQYGMSSTLPYVTGLVADAEL